MNLDHPDWYAIRPWSRRFTLSVKEVTSVSATFTLSSTFDGLNELDPSLASLGLTVSDDEESDTQRNRVVADALSKGLSVKVNNSPWQRVLLRVDEEADEALIIVFGLISGRQYDIELGITPRKEPLRSQITTDQSPDHPDSARDENPLLISNSDELQSSLSPDSPSTSPTMTTSTLDASSNSISPPSTFALEDRVQHTLTMLQSERESLIGSLKGARRDTQKADASIRSEIDTLKRASEKYSSVEHRARQKVLALQEAVKQTLAATSETGALVLELEASLQILREQRDEAEKEYRIVKENADKIRDEKAMLEKKEKRRIESMQSELVGLGNRLEKLNGKKDKLETGTIPDLEEELKRIEVEIEKLEKEPPGFEETPEETQPRVTSVDHDHPNIEVPAPNFLQQPHRRKSRTGKSQHLPIQRPVQILRPPNQPTPQPTIGSKSTTTRISPSTSSTSTLSGLARPFEPSATRQAQLQGTLQTAASASVKSDLNPASTIFSPRLAYQPTGNKRTSWNCKT